MRYGAQSPPPITLPALPTATRTFDSGCLKKEWQVGDLMLIRGYLDYTFSLKKGEPEIVNIEMGDK